MNFIISHPQCYSEKGKKPNQEDSLFPHRNKATKNTRVFLVCDGMGGHENGEVASACVADTIGQMTSALPCSTTDEMRNAFEGALAKAYQNLDELDHSESEKKMGTTLTFLALCKDGVLVAHIGDSRVYQLRPGKGIVFQTRDHSLVNDLVAAGEITPEEAMAHPQRNVITRAIQPHQEYPAKASFTIVNDVQKGDVFFMCCDGVVEQLSNDDLCTYLLNDEPTNKRIARIQQECEARETRDNNTAYLIKVADIVNNDTIELVDDTLLRKPTAKKVHKFTILIIVLIFAIIGTLTFFYLSDSSSNDTKDTTPHNETQQTEQVQGTIARHRK